MEVDIAKAGLHMLIEKPISMRPAEEVERLAQVILFLLSCMHLHTDTLQFGTQSCRSLCVDTCIPTYHVLIQSLLKCIFAVSCVHFQLHMP